MYLTKIYLYKIYNINAPLKIEPQNGEIINKKTIITLILKTYHDR